MKLLAIIITYYPCVDETYNNILQFIKFVDKLIIWENTPSIDREKYRVTLSTYSDKIIYRSSNKNEGIALPLNFAIKFGLDNGFTHLLTMDQDSYWINFSQFKNHLITIKADKIIAFTPSISCLNNTTNKDEYTVIEECITSGTIYNLNLCKIVGPFREDYFIDAVDLEYCIRCNSKGYQTILLPYGYLNHKLGNPKKIKNKWITSNYSSFRTYHIIRNYIWLWKEYPNIFNKKDYLFRESILRLIKIILGEEDKLNKVSSIIKGIYHGITRK